jgi:hypothetical protein
MTVAEIAASMALEPIDVLLSIEGIIKSPGDWKAWAAVLPFVPAAIRHMPSGAGLHAAKQTLGKPYDSAVLRANLKQFDITGGADSIAHHIIGNNQPAQNLIHPILKKFEIDINDAANGMLLDSSFHLKLGTREYRNYVVSRIRVVNSEADLLSTLDELKSELLRKQQEFRDHGTIPRFGSCNGGQ